MVSPQPVARSQFRALLKTIADARRVRCQRTAHARAHEEHSPAAPSSFRSAASFDTMSRMRRRLPIRIRRCSSTRTSRTASSIRTTTATTAWRVWTLSAPAQRHLHARHSCVGRARCSRTGRIGDLAPLPVTNIVPPMPLESKRSESGSPPTSSRNIPLRRLHAPRHSRRSIWRDYSGHTPGHRSIDISWSYGSPRLTRACGTARPM